jgi:hypothetical protein
MTARHQRCFQKLLFVFEVPEVLRGRCDARVRDLGVVKIAVVTVAAAVAQKQQLRLRQNLDKFGVVDARQRDGVTDRVAGHVLDLIDDDTVELAVANTGAPERNGRRRWGLEAKFRHVFRPPVSDAPSRRA